MTIYFYVLFEAIAKKPGAFSSEMMGMSSNPFMAMLDMQSKSDDLIGDSSQATCILYSCPAWSADISNLTSLVPQGRPIENSNINVLGVLCLNGIFFMHEGDKIHYHEMLKEFTTLSLPESDQDVSIRWKFAFERKDEHLARLMGSPPMKRRRSTESDNKAMPDRSANSSLKKR